MIDDPDEPDYRRPAPGEVLWHRPTQAWVQVTDWEAFGEVPVRRIPDGQLLTVKLRSLEER